MQLPHHRGLPDTLHGLAEQPADQHQHDQLREEDRPRTGRLPGAFGGRSGAGRNSGSASSAASQPATSGAGLEQRKSARS